MVHASQYFFHFDFYESLPQNLVFKLNKVLPNDISIFEIIPVEGFPHAQYSATMRTYNYLIHTYKNPFICNLSSLYIFEKIDVDRMQKAVALLTKYHDYSNFCRSPLQNESNICTITNAQLFVSSNVEKLRFQISSKRFLQGMVRLIVQRLIDIGTGELSIDEYESYLACKNTPKKLKAAYPQGLYLSKIEYPFLNIPQQPNFGSIL